MTLWTVAHQAPLSMGFPRQEYWSGLPFLPPGDLPDPGIEPESSVSPALVGFFTTEPLGKPSNLIAKIRSLINVCWESWLNGWHTMSAYRIFSKNVICMKYINLEIITWGICALLWTTKLRQRSVKQSACTHRLSDVAVIHTEAQPTVYSQPLGTLPLLMTKLFILVKNPPVLGRTQ